MTHEGVRGLAARRSVKVERMDNGVRFEPHVLVD
jgi:hypothetical protein